MFSFVGDTVLDPFLGTGSTTEAAMQAHRSSIGFEIEEAYLQMVEKRFSQARMDAELTIVRPKTKHP
jgi:site-specific DNA-methyltransferase (adenine-specific)